MQAVATDERRTVKLPPVLRYMIRAFSYSLVTAFMRVHLEPKQ